MVVNGLVVGLQQSGCGHTVELLAALEEGDLEDEEVPGQNATELLDESTGSSGRSTCAKRLAVVEAWENVDEVR